MHELMEELERLKDPDNRKEFEINMRKELAYEFARQLQGRKGWEDINFDAARKFAQDNIIFEWKGYMPTARIYFGDKENFTKEEFMEMIEIYGMGRMDDEIERETDWKDDCDSE